LALVDFKNRGAFLKDHPEVLAQTEIVKGRAITQMILQDSGFKVGVDQDSTPSSGPAQNF
jgi:hypothetical protein